MSTLLLCVSTVLASVVPDIYPRPIYISIHEVTLDTNRWTGQIWTATFPSEVVDKYWYQI